MKRKILMMMAAFVGIISGTAIAQDRLKMEIGYNLSAPLGSFKNDYIGNTSFRGFTGAISYSINPKFSLGLNSGYQNYYQKYGRQLYKTGLNETTSAVVTNSMDVIPFMLRGTYFPMGGSRSIQPYVSAGAGVNVVNYSQYLGQFPETDISFPLAAQAGAGVMIPLGKALRESTFKLGATYNYAAYNKNNLSNLSSVGAHAGIVFAIR